MNMQTTLSEKGQVVIPKDVRDALGLRPGQKLDIIRSGNGVFLRPAHQKSGRTAEEIFAHIREIAPKWEGPPVTDEQMKAGIDQMFRDTWKGMTRALDTNIIVRFLADPASLQHALAHRLLTEDFIITTSVMMESEWVLRSVYRWKREQIVQAFRMIFELPGFLSVPRELAWIIERYRLGADFADMAHLAAAAGASSFATFDRNLAKQAGDATPIAIEVIA